MTQAPRRPAFQRVLIVEDDPAREKLLVSWLPEGFRAVVATSAGSAIGILQRDPGDVYAAILLDHDLQLRTRGGADAHLSGRDVVDAVVRHVSRSTSIVVHSMNASQAAPMTQALLRAGFEARQVPMSSLDEPFLKAWLGSVRNRFKGAEDEEE